MFLHQQVARRPAADDDQPRGHDGGDHGAGHRLRESADALLGDANLKKADLRGDDLHGANLSHANLSGADLVTVAHTVAGVRLRRDVARDEGPARLGIGDGTVTELVGGSLKPGQDVIVGGGPKAAQATNLLVTACVSASTSSPSIAATRASSRRG